MRVTVDPAALEARFDVAEQAVTTERRRVAAERDALRRFSEHVENTRSPRSRPSPTVPAMDLRRESDDSLQRIREAYERTFMAVSHYEEDYDETYAENVLEEFGPNIATVLLYGDQFTAACKRALEGSLSQSITKRERLLEALDDEQESVAEARGALVTLADELVEISRSVRTECPAGMLDAHDARIGVLVEKSEQLLNERQATVVSQRRSLTLPIDQADVPTYVYHDTDIETDYPILDTLADCVGTLETLRQEIRSTQERRVSVRLPTRVETYTRS